MNSSPFATLQGGAATLRLHTAIYSLDSIRAVGHVWTDRCWVQIEPSGPDEVQVRLQPRLVFSNIEACAKEFLQDLLDQTLREKLIRETEPVRRLLIAQAFSKVNLLGDVQDSAPAGHAPAEA